MRISDWSSDVCSSDLLAEGADAAAMTRSIPMEKALDDCMVAFAMNGEALRPEQGYPLRLVVPGWEGNMWVKWLRRLEVGDRAWHNREETRSEERRVGKECVSTCRSRRSPDHSKKNLNDMNRSELDIQDRYQDSRQ